MESVDFFGWSLVDEKDFVTIPWKCFNINTYDNLGSNLSQHSRPRFQRHRTTRKRARQ